MKKPSSVKIDEVIVDLEEVAGGSDVLILSGKRPGLASRAHFHLDDMDSDPSKEVIVRINVPTLTSSFILGMFGNSAKKLGLDGFWKKYKFETRNSIKENIAENVLYAISEKTALDI